MQSPEYAIQTTGLSKSFGNGKLEVIKKLDFALERGKFEAIMGPSGSGKSTFLHLAAGLLRPDAGSIKIGGIETTALSDREMTIFRRRKIGLVFQDFNLVETLTAEENIALPQLLDGAESDDTRIQEIMDKFGILKRRSHLPSQMSGGERQRVAIARALAANPAVVLADEPTGNLDFPNAQKLCAIISDLNADTGCAVLLVSHDPVVAAHAEKIHIIKDGVIVDSFDSCHTPETVSERYIAAMEQKERE